MSKIKSFFMSTKESPYHLSVGAVLIDKEGKIACHYFKEFQTPEQSTITNSYILMRETVELGESLEKAVLRGIREEFGSTGEIRRLLGTLLTKFPRGDVWIEKTTVYFLVDLLSSDIPLRLEDNEEKGSERRWESIEFLIAKMEEQGQKYERTDLDESEILNRAKKYLS